MARKYNLEEEMKKKKVSRQDLCNVLGITYKALLLKITGQTEFKCDEMFEIKATLKSKKSLDELFKDK